MHIFGIFKWHYRYIDYKKGYKHLKTLCAHSCIYVCMCARSLDIARTPSQPALSNNSQQAAGDSTSSSDKLPLSRRSISTTPYTLLKQKKILILHATHSIAIYA